MPVEARVLDRWSDGSVRWHLVNSQLSFERCASFVLEVAECDALKSPLQSQSEGDGFAIETGSERFVVRPGPGLPLFRRSSADSSEVEIGRFVWVDDKQREIEPRFDRVALLHDGTVTTSLLCFGTLGSRVAPKLALQLQLDFHAHASFVKMALTIRNPTRALHRGGIWELGDPNSVLFERLSLELPARHSDRLRFSVSPEVPLAPCPAPLRLLQESSGGENWQSPVHVNRNGEVALAGRGFRLVTGDDESRDLRASPRCLVGVGETAIGAAIENFWQDFPSAMEFDGECLSLGLFPRTTDLHELQGGEQKTLRWWLQVGERGLAPSPDPLLWCVEPSFVRTTPEQYRASAVEPMLVTAAEDENERRLTLLQGAIEGDDSFFAKRERADEYGWRHFGELFADHESLGSDQDRLVVSHYNNQYDGIYGLGLQFLRTGDRRWWSLMNDLARHVADVDIYHTKADRAAYNGGLFWHTDHYRDAGKSTHRAYPADSHGGGHHSEHAYNLGLMLHYLLTGDRVSMASAIEMANWLKNAEDGAQRMTRLIDDGPVGTLSVTASIDYHGPGRAPGNSILCLLTAYRLGNDDVLLRLAEELIHRCCHPRDDIASRNLEDVEKRWSYTVFLYTLGHYLAFKEERAELDEKYWYAREALLHYARWMVSNESIYLERPDQLEFPNHTWSAQELRKSDVLALAARYSEAERDMFIERARFFNERAVAALEETPERSFTRLLVLTLRHGAMLSGLETEASGVPAKPDRDFDFGEPVPFESLWIRLENRFPKMFRLWEWLRRFR